MLCGYPITDYEHIDPEFKDARSHDPAHMALLCKRCHGEVTTGRTSKETVLAARRNPVKFRESGQRGGFDIAPPFELILGDNVIRDIRCVVCHGEGEEWFTIDPPEERDGPPLISAKFYSLDGNVALDIEKNYWAPSSEAWDIETIGPTTTVREGRGRITLQFRVQPPHGLALQRLEMSLSDSGITIDSTGTVTLRSGATCFAMVASSVRRGDCLFTVP